MVSLCPIFSTDFWHDFLRCTRHFHGRLMPFGSSFFFGGGSFHRSRFLSPRLLLSVFFVGLFALCVYVFSFLFSPLFFGFVFFFLSVPVQVPRRWIDEKMEDEARQRLRQVVGWNRGFCGKGIFSKEITSFLGPENFRFLGGLSWRRLFDTLARHSLF